MVKDAVFSSYEALEMWKRKNHGKVSIISIGAPAIELGYDVSIKLRNLGIKVTYIEFEEGPQ